MAEVRLLITSDSKGAVKSIERVSGKTEQLGKKSEKAKKKYGRFSKGLGDSVQTMTGVRLGMLGIVGAATAFVGGIAKATKDTIALGTSLVDLRSQTGLSIQELQELQFAAEQSGVNFDQLKNSVLRLGRRAAAELPETTKFLDKLGLSVSDIVDRKPGDAFGLVAEKIRSIDSPAQQAAAAMGIFGDAGLQVLPAINQGIEGNIERFRQLDVAMSDDAAEAAKEFGDRLTDLSARLTGIKTTVGNVVIPVLTGLIDLFGTILPSAIRLGLDAALGEAARAFDLLALAPGRVGEAFTSMADKARNLGRDLRKTAEEDMGEFFRRSIETKQPTAELGGQIDKTTASVQANAGALAAANANARAFTGAVVAMPPRLQEQGVALDEADANLREHEARMFQAKLAAIELGLVTAEVGTETVRTSKVMSAAWAEMELKRQKNSSGTLEFMKGSNADLLSNSLTIFGGLSSHFKAVAIAGAVISTYSAIAKAMAAYPWPFNLVAAAAAGAAGFANVNRIRSSDAGFQTGTAGLDFQDFGRESPARLHGEEAVIPRGGGHRLAGEIASALGRRGGGAGGVSIGNVTLNAGQRESPDDFARRFIRTLRDDPRMRNEFDSRALAATS